MTLREREKNLYFYILLFLFSFVCGFSSCPSSFFSCFSLSIPFFCSPFSILLLSIFFLFSPSYLLFLFFFRFFFSLRSLSFLSSSPFPCTLLLLFSHFFPSLLLLFFLLLPFSASPFPFFCLSPLVVLPFFPPSLFHEISF